MAQDTETREEIHRQWIGIVLLLEINKSEINNSIETMCLNEFQSI